MKYFFDRNLPAGMAHMLVEMPGEHEVVHQDDDSRFHPTSSDVYIIQALAAESPRPVLVTGDINMVTRDPIERKALADSGLTVVLFKKSFRHLPFQRFAWKVVKAWPEIVKATTRCREPTAFEVTARGKVEKMCFTRNL